MHINACFAGVCDAGGALVRRANLVARQAGTAAGRAHKAAAAGGGGGTGGGSGSGSKAGRGSKTGR